MGVSKILVKIPSSLSTLLLSLVYMWALLQPCKEKPLLIILAFSNFLSVPHSPSHHFSTHPIISSKCVISRGNNVIFTTIWHKSFYLFFLVSSQNCIITENTVLDQWKYFQINLHLNIFCTKGISLDPAWCPTSVYQMEIKITFISHADEAESEGQGSKGEGA